MQFTPWDNPMGTDGFEFVEYAAPDPAALGKLFETMGFSAIAKHRTKNVTLYRQGDVNFIINAEPNSFAQRFARQHGPSVCAMAFRVEDAKLAYERALELGAWGFDNHTGPMELNIPAIKGIGDSLIYFVDRWHGKDGAQRRCDRQHQHLRRRLRADPRRKRRSQGKRPDLHRPPDAQRAPWPHEGVGRLLRAPVQLQGSALLRHRRQVDRTEEQGDDEPVRQDPDSNQREFRRQESDRGIPRPVPRRRHPAHRARDRHDLCDRRRDEEVPASRSRTRSRLTTTWSTSGCRTTARTSTS